MFKQLTIGFCTLTLLACIGDTPPPPAQTSSTAPLSVQTVTLSNTDFVPTIATTGTIQAVDEVVLSVDFSAPVERILVREGQRVKQGDLLLALDSEKLRHQLTRAKQVLKQNESKYREAKRNLARRQELAQQNTLSEELLDNAEHESVRAQAAAEEARAAVRLAQRSLTESQIVSPVSGVVDQRMVDTGETIQSGQALLTIQATGNLEVKTFVSERDIHLVKAGGKGHIRLANWPEQAFAVTVTTAGIAADPRTGNFPVKLLIEQRDSRLRPGMTARVTIMGETQQSVLVLPEAALLDYQRAPAVFVANGQKAELRHPRFSVGLGKHIQVLSGLEVGDKVIVSHLNLLRDGTVISPSEVEPP